MADENPDGAEEESFFALSILETAMVYGALYYQACLTENVSDEDILREIERREIFFEGRKKLLPGLKAQRQLVGEMREYLIEAYGIEQVLQLETSVKNVMKGI